MNIIWETPNSVLERGHLLKQKRTRGCNAERFCDKECGTNEHVLVVDSTLRCKQSRIFPRIWTTTKQNRVATAIPKGKVVRMPCLDSELPQQSQREHQACGYDMRICLLH